MKKLLTKEILIGFMLILSLAILFIGIDFLKGVNVFKPADLYYVSFTDVSGLTEASPVTLNGMKIGQVTDIQYEYDNPGHVAVEIRLESPVRITKGSEVVMTTSLLGTAELALKMAQGTEFYEKGDRMPGSKAGDLMADISKDVLPEVIKMLPHLNSILANIDSLVSNPALQTTIVRLDAISRNIETTTLRLAAVSKRMDPMMSDVSGIVANLDTISGDLKLLSAELKGIPLQETMDNVKTTTGNLAQITTQLNGKDSTLGLLLNDKGLYDHIDSTIKSLDSVLIDLRANPKKYVNFKLL